MLAATPTGGHIYAKLLFLWKFGGTRWEDVSTGILFKRIHFTQTWGHISIANKGWFKRACEPSRS